MLSEQEGIILVVNIAFSYKQRESVAHKIVLGAINDGENSFRILKTTTLKAIADYVKVDTRNSGVVNANFAEMNYISKNGASDEESIEATSESQESSFVTPAKSEVKASKKKPN